MPKEVKKKKKNFISSKSKTAADKKLAGKYRATKGAELLIYKVIYENKIITVAPLKFIKTQRGVENTIKR